MGDGEQLALFTLEGLATEVSSLLDDVARARAYRDHVLATRVCVDCCGDARLRFQRRHAGELEVSDLVARGASQARLARAMLACEVICQRCQLGRLRRGHKMLRAAPASSAVIAAKAATTTDGSESALTRSRSKARAIVRKRGNVA